MSGLVPTAACPVCGSRERSAAPDGMAKRKDAGVNYLKHAAARLGMTTDALVDAAEVKRCASCATTYCDPWLSPETASDLFTSRSPDHVAGWGTFEHWLSSDRPNKTQEHALRFWDAVARRVGPVSAYAEFGCPFQGALLAMRAQEKAPTERVAAFAATLGRERDTRWAGSAKLHHAATRAADWLASSYHRLRLLKERGPRPAPLAVPAKRWLLTHDTVRAWGGNCTRYGGTCRHFAHRLLGVDVLPFDDAVRTGAPKLDVLGVFNFLDHAADPMTVLKGGLSLARHVAVSVHHASQAGKQHQFALDESFPAWLAKALPEAEVVDLSAELANGGPRDNNYVLLSRRSR